MAKNDILDIDSKLKIFFDKESKKLDKYIKRLDFLKNLYENLDISNPFFHKIKHDLNQDIFQMEQLIKRLNDLKFYEMDTLNILNAYLKLITTKQTNFNKKQLEKEKNILIEKYLSFLKSYNFPEIIFESNIFDSVTKNDLLSKDFIICGGCGFTGESKDFEWEEDSIYICIYCFTESKMIVNLVSYGDSERINVSNKYIYDRKSHFKDCINQYQGKQNTVIPDYIYANLTKAFIENGLISENPTKKSLKKITRAHVILFLKEFGYTKFYEDSILIHSTIVGKKLDNIYHLEENLLRDFDILLDVYSKIFKNIERKNFINTHFVLFQLLKRHGHKCDPSDFSILKTNDRKSYHEYICKTLFEELGWKYFGD